MASDQQQQDEQRPHFFQSSGYGQPPPIDRSMMPSPFRIDEGFSEETHADSELVSFATPDQTLSEPNSATHSTNVDALRDWLLAQPVQLRAAVARDLLASVPTSLLSSLVVEANARLHFDPIRCLPKEIISHILEFLDPPALLNASLVSRLWTPHASEPRLWKYLFAQEGWTHNASKIRAFEDSCLSQIRSFNTLRALRHHFSTISNVDSLRSLRSYRSSLSTEGTEQGQVSRLRVKEGIIDLPSAWPPYPSSISPPRADYATTSTTTNSANAHPSPRSPDRDEEMHDAPDINNSGDASFDFSNPPPSVPGIPTCPLLLPPYLTDAFDQKPQPNWKYIFKQRRKLEQNWIDCRFTPFRLPHPDYPDDAHRQCVYTLQFSPKYVVSGSRDKSVRVWDLSTQRLKMLPLLGHDGSVLCVQFDERPDQDVIISGSSDADVIVWRFSTGGIIKRLRKAHAESVLNLRFDDRYLVTCSKDKTIKLWNRKELLPTDPEYPQTNQSPNATYPQYILDVKALYTKPRASITTPLMPYTLLMTLNEHNAAVNAIQIHGNEIVSASGDRKIMLWDVPSGRLIRTFVGHSKGIACVQYDGRRIISGSSDNSVRIFDSATSAEVAVLDGHRDLVRTIQADFGDVAGDDVVLETQARQNDERVLQNKRMELDGEQAPQDATPWVFGAKIPPNGGGSKWSKIISGSYDETVIIWRKDKNGQWVAAKELRQDDAIKATTLGSDRIDSATTNFIIQNAGMRTYGIGNTIPFHMNLPIEQIFQRATEVGMPANLSGRARLLWIRQNLYIGRPQRPGVIQFYRILGTCSANSTQPMNLPPSPPSQTLFANLAGPVPAHLHPNHPQFQHFASPPSPAIRGLINRPDIFHHVARQLTDPQIQLYFQQHLTRALFAASAELQQNAGVAVTQDTGQSSSEEPDNGASATAENQAANHSQPQAQEQTSNSTGQIEADAPPPWQPNLAAAASQDNQAQPAPSNIQGQASPQANTPGSGSEAQPTTTQQQPPPTIHIEPGFSRVFKLQFDSRRIICCSQQPIMVGWDFANGDRDIEEASQFFD